MNDVVPSTRTLMACLGDASRFKLVQALLQGARCVTDLATEVGLSQSCTTRHLQALERRRIVLGARDGKRVLYRLRHNEPALKPLLIWALQPYGDGSSPRSEKGGDDRSGRRAGRQARPPRPAVRRDATEAPTERRERTGETESTAPVEASTPALPPAREEQPAGPGVGPPRPARSSQLEDYLL